MRIFRRIVVLPAEFRGASAAIGNFDGVHRGHRAVLDAARAAASRHRAPLGVVTFEPHPREVLTPIEAPRRLTPFRRKAEIFRDLGVDLLVVLPFEAALMRLSPHDFAADILHRRLGIHAIAAGVDFRFGHKRAGSLGLLQELGDTLGFDVQSVAPMSIDGRTCSSTLIRELLDAGRIVDANSILGYAFEVEGVVKPGDARGRTIGFPTANVHTFGRGQMMPFKGVYAVRAGLYTGGGVARHDAVAYLGNRPTFDGRSLLLEVHILEGSHMLYGRRIKVAFLDRVRGEQKFEGLDQLRAQIGRDCLVARRIHNTLPA